MVELRLKMIFVTPGITVIAGKLTTIVGVYAVTTPEPAIDKLVFVEDSLEVLGNVLNHFRRTFLWTASLVNSRIASDAIHRAFFESIL